MNALLLRMTFDAAALCAGVCYVVTGTDELGMPYYAYHTNKDAMRDTERLLRTVRFNGVGWVEP